MAIRSILLLFTGVAFACAFDVLQTCSGNACPAPSDAASMIQSRLHLDGVGSQQGMALAGLGDKDLYAGDEEDPSSNEGDGFLGNCEELWQENQAPEAASDKKCYWRDMVAATADVFGGGSPPKICVRDFHDIVSDAVRSSGFWGDCTILSDLWAMPDKSLQASASTNYKTCGANAPAERTKLFVDIGANVGSCTLQMLARPDVSKVVAFEPNPDNLFYLTNSIRKNPGFSSKISLYPLGLSDSTSMHRMYEQKGNFGNSVFDTPVTDTANDADDKVKVQVKTRTLDDIFFAGGSPPYIHLMKIDVQGFETKVLKGGTRLLKSGAIRAIKLEVAKKWLRSQKTSALEVFNTLSASGYALLRDPSSATDLATNQMSRQSIQEMACSDPDDVHDIVAIHDPAKAELAITCPAYGAAIDAGAV